MIPVQIRVTKKLMKDLDDLVKQGLYSNRSQAIRDAIRKHIINRQEPFSSSRPELAGFLKRDSVDNGYSKEPVHDNPGWAVVNFGND